MQPLIQFFGRLHPMVLHAPIGLLIGIVALEGISILGGKPMDPRVRSVLAWLAAISAVFSATAGFVLSYESEYDAAAIQLHMWLGIGVAVGCVLAAILQQTGKTRAFWVVLALAAGAIVPAGHFGAGITHGPGYLMAPFNERRTAAVGPSVAGTPTTTAAAADSEYAVVIAPILQSRCAGCHGAARQKGGLALHTVEAIRKGGKNGAIFVAGNPEGSEMMRRLWLPIDNEDHMPPESKVQPTAEEIRAIEDWIRAGASFDAPRGATPGTAETPHVEKPATPERTGPVAPDSKALWAIREALVHVEPIEQGSHLLQIDFAAAASKLDEPELIRLLEPVREQVADLSLARSRAGDALMPVVGRMPNLTRLNLSGTAVTDAGIAALKGDGKLEELILTMDHLTDAAGASIAALPSLKRVYIWKSGISAGALAALHERSVVVDTGEARAAAPLEAETEVKFTGTAPPPAPAAVPSAEALKPVNAVCPVSGKPVDPNYAVVYKGKVIGFCCPNCPKDFWADPEKFLSKLR